MKVWLSQEDWHCFVTFNFNAHTSLVSGKTTLKRFHAKIDRQLYGRNFNDLRFDERTLFIAFPEHVESNLHYHALLRTQNSDFSSTALKTWESLVPSGSLHIVNLKEQGAGKGDYENISCYITKELQCHERYEQFVISSEFSSI